MFFKYPYTNFNERNLDWLLKKMGELEPAIPMVQEALPLLTEARETAAEAALLAETAQATVDTVIDTSQAAQTVANNANSVAQVANTNAANALERAEYAKTVAENAATSAAGAVTTANDASTLASAAQSNSALAVQEAQAAEALARSATAAATWKYHGILEAGTPLVLPGGSGTPSWSELLCVFYLDGSPTGARSVLNAPNMRRFTSLPTGVYYATYSYQVTSYGQVDVDMDNNTINFYQPGATTYRAAILYR